MARDQSARKSSNTQERSISEENDCATEALPMTCIHKTLRTSSCPQSQNTTTTISSIRTALPIADIERQLLSTQGMGEGKTPNLKMGQGRGEKENVGT